MFRLLKSPKSAFLKFALKTATNRSRAPPSVRPIVRKNLKKIYIFPEGRTERTHPQPQTRLRKWERSAFAYLSFSSTLNVSRCI
ncbi:hypothetical protein L596_015582 [Steinernema carpocapsae]|uniref:Uncharacterized protein n=1 Tax=Steinernema carpocapsae TaxID=34508 RepID=A0A4U5NFD9_STECR|nr:hypothetical protein L596_015582 [Steinernema carpocapsae]